MSLIVSMDKNLDAKDDNSQQQQSLVSTPESGARDMIAANGRKFSISAPQSLEEFETAVDYLCALLLFGSKWEEGMVRSPRLRREIPGLQDLPLVCKAHECPYAAVCPVLREMPQAQWRTLVGTPCRADVVYSTKLFADQVQSLNVGPEHSSDIISISNLIRYMIIQRRLDWELALRGMTEKRVDAINPVDGEVFWKSTPTELLKEMERVNKQIAVIQSQLASTRRDRQAQQNTERTQQNILTQLLASSRARKASIETQPVTVVNNDVIDADFSEAEVNDTRDSG